MVRVSLILYFVWCVLGTLQEDIFTASIPENGHRSGYVAYFK